MGFFDNSATGEMGEQEVNELQKALSAGYGTDSANYTGGRALIPENLESETVNVVAQLKEDCKIMNSVKKTPVRSTVHEVNLRTDHGNWRHLSVAEGGESVDTDQSLERKAFAMKYLQTRRSVTKQMEAAETFEGALASEKLAGVETIIKGAEYQCFHGDSAVVPTEFDGFISSIKKAKEDDRNIIDLRGSSLGSYGEKIFDEIAAKVRTKGGFVDKAMYPVVLAKEIKEMFADKQRYVMNNPLQNLSFKSIPDYGTAVGANIALSGEDAGDDLFYECKGAVFAEGDPMRRPPAPAGVTVAAAVNAASSFAAADAGAYMYKVHAVNQYGISEGTEIKAAVAVAAGAGVTITITPSAGIAATGFIICRSAKGGKTCMEMVKVPNSGKSTTVHVDLNKDLPGTASMLFLPKKRLQPIYTFSQLLPVCTFPLAATNKAETPFLVMMFGALEVRAAKHMGLVENISYAGGLY